MAEQKPFGLARVETTAPSASSLITLPSTNNQKPDATLIIDLQLGCIGIMEIEDAKAYLDKLAEKIQFLRNNNIPIVWVTVGLKNQLHEPIHSKPPENRGDAFFNATEFYGIKDDPKDVDYKKILHEFLNTYGPRTDEAVFQKASFGAFDIKFFDASQANMLTKYFRANGFKAPLVFGAVSSACVSETAIGAAIQGFNPIICADLVVSWLDDNRVREIPHGLWKTATHLSHHIGAITNKIRETIVDRGRNRNFKPDEVQAIKRIPLTSFDSATQHLTSNKPDVTRENTTAPGNHLVSKPKGSDAG